jgi:hypothetical protein
MQLKSQLDGLHRSNSDFRIINIYSSREDIVPASSGTLDFADMNVDLADTGKTHFNFMEAPAGSRLYTVLVSTVFTVARHAPMLDAPTAAAVIPVVADSGPMTASPAPEPEAPAATVEASPPENPATPEETPPSSEAAPPPAPQPVASGAYSAYYGPNQSPYYANPAEQYSRRWTYNGWSGGYRQTYTRPTQRYHNRRW